MKRSANKPLAVTENTARITAGIPFPEKGFVHCWLSMAK